MNTRQRDHVIENWQSRIKDTDNCTPFRDQMRAEGREHRSAATGAFITGMQRIKAVAQASGCLK